MREVIELLLWIGLVAFTITQCVPSKVAAHSWYPIECCSSLDCAEAQIESITIPTGERSLPITIVKTKFGTAVVPPNFPLRESKDGQLHACMRPQSDGTMKLLCLFVPPSM